MRHKRWYLLVTGEIFRYWLAADDGSMRKVDKHVTLTRVSVTATGESLVDKAECDTINASEEIKAIVLEAIDETRPSDLATLTQQGV